MFEIIRKCNLFEIIRSISFSLCSRSTATGRRIDANAVFAGDIHRWRRFCTRCSTPFKLRDQPRFSVELKVIDNCSLMGFITRHNRLHYLSSSQLRSRSTAAAGSAGGEEREARSTAAAGSAAAVCRRRRGGRGARRQRDRRRLGAGGGGVGEEHGGCGMSENESESESESESERRGRGRGSGEKRG